MAGYVTASLAFVHAEIDGIGGEQFQRFLKNDLLRFHLVSLLF